MVYVFDRLHFNFIVFYILTACWNYTINFRRPTGRHVLTFLAHHSLTSILIYQGRHDDYHFIRAGLLHATFDKRKKLPHWRHDGARRRLCDWVDTDGAIKAAICRRPRAALRPMLALFVACCIASMSLVFVFVRTALRLSHNGEGAILNMKIISWIKNRFDIF